MKERDPTAPEILLINMDDDAERFMAISTRLDALGISCRRVAAVDGTRLPEGERDAAYSSSLCNRVVERTYCDVHLADADLVAFIGDLRHYRFRG